MSRFTGNYSEDGKQRRLQTRAEAGHRCIRCGHPFESGKHGKGEWSPCDKLCTHGTPIRVQAPGDLSFVEVNRDSSMVLTVAQAVELGMIVEAKWRILTVHHLDGKKDNDHWANTLSLCQRCHLQIQNKVDPNTPYFLEHSDWFKPYAAAYYAKKYLGEILTREQVTERLEELLQLERIA